MILLKQNDKRYKINYAKPVKVYRNLHKGCWSIRQNGLVKAHADKIDLFKCEFLVNEKDRLKVIKEKRKNVHAFVKGYLWDTPLNLIKQVAYNPYIRDSFFDTDDYNSVDEANFVKMINGKVFYN
jgi:hypothetical protein